MNIFYVTNSAFGFHTVKCINYTVINMKTTHGAAYKTAKWISEISLEKNIDGMLI
jgi:hypothetical protein